MAIVCGLLWLFLLASVFSAPSIPRNKSVVQEIKGINNQSREAPVQLTDQPHLPSPEPVSSESSVVAPSPNDSGPSIQGSFSSWNDSHSTDLTTSGDECCDNTTSISSNDTSSATEDSTEVYNVTSNYADLPSSQEEAYPTDFTTPSVSFAEDTNDNQRSTSMIEFETFSIKEIDGSDLPITDDPQGLVMPVSPQPQPQVENPQVSKFDDSNFNVLQGPLNRIERSSKDLKLEGEDEFFQESETHFCEEDHSGSLKRSRREPKIGRQRKSRRTMEPTTVEVQFETRNKFIDIPQKAAEEESDDSNSIFNLMNHTAINNLLVKPMSEENDIPKTKPDHEHPFERRYHINTHLGEKTKVELMVDHDNKKPIKFPFEMHRLPISGHKKENSSIDLEFLLQIKKKDGCSTGKVSLTLREKGCITKVIRNKYCIGQCKSFYIPQEPFEWEEDDAYALDYLDSLVPAFQSCGMCEPHKYRWRAVTLQCPGLKPPMKMLRYMRIQACRCKASSCK